MKIIYSNRQKFDDTVDKFKKDGFDKLHVVADFDRTLTKAFSAGKKRPSLISVLRSEGYLGEEYVKKAYELWDKYIPIEADPNIDINEKAKEMTDWRNEHLDLLVKSGLSRQDIESVIDSELIEFRNGVVDFLSILDKNSVPLVIISANGLGTDSTRLYFEKQGVLSHNVYVISNSFVWNEEGKAIGYDKRVVHTFNKGEVVLEEFPEIYSKVKDRKNVILLGDSLGDHTMADSFEYDNVLKIGFLNDKEDKLLDEYKKIYDVIVTGDGDFSVVNEILEKL